MVVEIKTFIDNKEFNQQLPGLQSRFQAFGMELKHFYSKGQLDVAIKLVGSSEVTSVIISKDGMLMFNYYDVDNQYKKEVFINCTINDFQTMIAHAFIYLRDNEMTYHQDWYSKLKRFTTPPS